MHGPWPELIFQCWHPGVCLLACRAQQFAKTDWQAALLAAARTHLSAHVQSIQHIAGVRTCTADAMGWILLHVQEASTWRIAAIKAADSTTGALTHAVKPFQPLRAALSRLWEAAASAAN